MHEAYTHRLVSIPSRREKQRIERQRAEARARASLSSGLSLRCSGRAVFCALAFMLLLLAYVARIVLAETAEMRITTKHEALNSQQRTASKTGKAGTETRHRDNS